MCNQIEAVAANRLTAQFIQHAAILPYANLDHNNNYLGWVHDFGLIANDNNVINLQLDREEDLFLLFVLAIVWSRTGPWENSAYFVAHLIDTDRSTPVFWQVHNDVIQQANQRQQAAIDAERNFNNPNRRRRISFRADIYNSIHILSNNWQNITAELLNANQDNNYINFMNYIRNIRGLGSNNNRILIKIPLILRELRCQHVFPNIPGQLCCVPDQRVLRAGNALGIILDNPYYNATNNINALINASTRIYELFGNLYDLPLFAYNDLQNFLHNENP